MSSTPQTKFRSRTCPVCGEASVDTIPWAFGTKRPTFRCASCESELTTVMLWHSWLAIPLAFIVFPLVGALLEWIDLTFALSGFARQLLHTVVVVPPVIGVTHVLLNGLVYRKWVARDAA